MRRMSAPGGISFLGIDLTGLDYLCLGNCVKGKFRSLVARVENVESGGRFGDSRVSPYESLAPRSYRSGKKRWGGGVAEFGVSGVGGPPGGGRGGAREGVGRRGQLCGACASRE